jgi:predicted CoA-substrate-specific enzyme activase
MLVCGCDVGSRTSKVVILDGDKIVASSIVPLEAEWDTAQAAEKALEAALAGSKISQGDIKYTVGTGYGEVSIPFANEIALDVSCLGKGNQWAMPWVRTIVDMGGEDCVVVQVDEKGNGVNFVNNEKCAAGTGRFLEDIAGVLDMKVEDLQEIDKQATEEVTITNQCSVFALAEVISLVALKTTVPNIVRGIIVGVANRVVSMVHRVGLVKEVALSGGVAKNGGVVRALEQKLGVKIATSSIEPQLMGALGAALIAQKKL